MAKSIEDVIKNLNSDITRNKRKPAVSFKEFIGRLASNPENILRNHFQLFHDMIKHHAIVKKDPGEDPESIGFKSYDLGKLFVKGFEHPFFADHLFANRLIRLADRLNEGTQQNKIHVFEGPTGSGKSTFLNALLTRFEEYTRLREGRIPETLWKLDLKKLGFKKDALSSVEIPDKGMRRPQIHMVNQNYLTAEDYYEVPCPSHDHPILLIPKNKRKGFLNEIINSNSFKKILFNSKEYEWVFRKEPCTICSSMYEAILKEVGDVDEVWDMIYVKDMVFDRRMGEGITVFSDKDREMPKQALCDEVIQEMLDRVFKGKKVRYEYSKFAKTNNGIFALMDAKGENVKRLVDLRGIVSEGCHRVGLHEEDVDSLFIVLRNPQDVERHEDLSDRAFKDREDITNINYVLSYDHELEIYRSTFGTKHEKRFLPKVLENFAKIVVATRLDTLTEGISEWITDPEKYMKYTDLNLKILKMELYSKNEVPQWISEEDRRRFTKNVRKTIIDDAQIEGVEGISGRESIDLFSDFLTWHGEKGKRMVTMDDVSTFFKEKFDLTDEGTPYRDNALEDSKLDDRNAPPDYFGGDLLGFIHQSYDTHVLEQIKDSAYDYNSKMIEKNIMRYLTAINYDIGDTVKCPVTGEAFQVTGKFLEEVEENLIGPNEETDSFERKTQETYSRTVAQAGSSPQDIKKTQFYKKLHRKYVYKLKENILDKLAGNDHFRDTIKEYGTAAFEKREGRLKKKVQFLMDNLQKKHGYTAEGAKEVCLYTIDNDLVEVLKEYTAELSEYQKRNEMFQR